MRSRIQLRGVLLDPRTVGAVFIVVAILSAIQRLLLPPKTFGADPNLYPNWNNFRIYVASFHHLVARQDIYAYFPAEQWDLYKYGPTFAALMAPFAVLPEPVSLVLWNLLNGVVLVVALRRLPLLARSLAWLGWVILPDYLTSLQNVQANVLLAGLMVLAFTFLEEDRPVIAALFVALATHVKIYPAAAVLLAFLYPRPWRFFAAFAAFVLALMVAPLAFVPLETLIRLYVSWRHLLLNDQTSYTGLSVMQLYRAVLGSEPPKTLLAAVGGAIATLPLVRLWSCADKRLRLIYLAQLLIFVVIFNHLAESSTFVIATVGVGIWYFARERKTWALVLLGFAFVFTEMSPRFPGTLAHATLASGLKVLPCVTIWAVAIAELFFLPKQAPGFERVAPNGDPSAGLQS